MAGTTAVRIPHPGLATFQPRFHGTLRRNFDGLSGTLNYGNFSAMLAACFAYKVVHEQYLLTRFVSSVRCQMHTLWMSVTYARAH